MRDDNLKRAKQLSDALNDINEIIHSTHETHEIMRRIVVESCKAIGAESADIVLRHNDSWVVEYVHGLPEELVGRRFTAAQAQPTLRAAGAGRPVAIDDALSDDRLDHGLAVEFNLKSLLGVSLMMREEVIGGLMFNYHTEKKTFTTSEIDFARKLKTSVSLALESARLYAEEREAMELSNALNRINMMILSTLSFDDILAGVVVEASKTLGTETAAIDVRDENYWIVKYVYGMPDELVGARMTGDELRHADIVKETKETLLVNDAYADERLNQELVRQFRIRSFLTVPLTIRGEVIGVMSFHYHSDAVSFTKVQLDFAGKLGALVSLTLQNARLYEVEHRIAATLQQSLLQMPERVSGIAFNHLYRSATIEAADVGGDFYDVFPLEHDRVGIIIGDVSGKGLAAATLTSLVKNTIKAFAHHERSPAEIIARTNYVLLMSLEGPALVTVFFGLFELETGALHYSNAGHPPPILKRGETTEYLRTGSPAIGMFKDLEFFSGQTRLNHKDVLVLYTDGVIEARDGAGLFGEQPLWNLADGWTSDPLKLPQAIYESVTDYARGRLADDLALLVIDFE